MTDYSPPSEQGSNDIDPVFVDEDDFNLLHQNLRNLVERTMVLEALQATDVPVGGLVLWYGLASAVPDGWHIADGGAGTLILSGLFVAGASSDTDLGVTGGGSSHSHPSMNTNDQGGHSHQLVSVGSSTWSSGAMVTMTGSVGYVFSHYHTIPASGTEDSPSHSHTMPATSIAVDLYPPYKRLYWIQRTY